MSREEASEAGGFRSEASGFEDNPEREGILKALSEAGSMDECYTAITRYFPGWISFRIERYSSDYPKLKQNWDKLCAITGSSPQAIVIVSAIRFDEAHKMLGHVTEYMTTRGYCVRRIGEIIPCEKCGLGLASEYVYNLLEKNGGKDVIPKRWSNKCSTC